MRRLTYFLALFAIFVQTHAQAWTTVDARQYKDETIVYASLDAASTSTPTDWVVGAFINGECRAEATMPSTGPDGSQIFVLRVCGDRDTDIGKAIFFRVYHKTRLVVFECDASRTVTFSTESEGAPSSPIILSFSDEELVPLEAFEWEADAMFDGEAAQLRLTPRPTNANNFKAASLLLSFDGNNGWENWPPATCQLLSKNPIVFLVTPTLPGNLDFHIALASDPTTHIPLYKKGDASHEQSHLDVSFRLALQQGWQWRSNPYGSVDFKGTDQFFGPDLIEVRTIDDLLYNDPRWGYFGTLVEKGLSENKAYKISMDTAFNCSTLGSGVPSGSHTENIVNGWNWIPSPYFFNHRIEHIFSPEQLTEGMVIVAKEEGQAEWNGTAWEGDLEILPARQSFLFYVPNNAAATTLSYQSEKGAPLTNDLPTIGVQSRAYAEGGTFVPVSPSRFRDNMTIVARLPELSASDDYIIGGFVDGECRGNGRCINGRFWLTVHCNGGDRISFQLMNQHTGRIVDITESIVCEQLRVGSLREPFIMHAPAAIQGIDDAAHLNDKGQMTNNECYDLQGRRLLSRPTSHSSSLRKGIFIERSNGKARCIVR